MKRLSLYYDALDLIKLFVFVFKVLFMKRLYWCVLSARKIGSYLLGAIYI